jgi:hypothetical protein
MSTVKKKGNEKTTKDKAAGSSTNSTLAATASQTVWWVPDDIDVWTLAHQSSGELPNGLINYEIISSGKTVSYPKHR